MISEGIVSLKLNFFTWAYVRMNYEKAKAKFSSNCHVVCVGKHNGEAKDVCSIPAKARAMPYEGL